MTLYTDAGATHNGFEDNVSFICVHDGEEVLLTEVIGNTTINVAEMRAIAEAINIAADLPTEIYSDSLLAVNLITRQWKGKKPHLKALVDQIVLPANISLDWIPREDNPAGWYLEREYHI
jgi:ribonuclease HI